MKTLALLFAASTTLAGDFLNLTFDSPNLSGPLTEIYPGGPFTGRADQILHGWSVQYDGQPQDSVFFSPVGHQWGIPVTLFENSPADQQSPLGPYSLVIDGPSSRSKEFRISQRGTIPADAAGLKIASAGYIQAFVNGTKVGEVNPLLGSHALLNVSAYSGQEVDLEFFVRAGDSARFDVLGFTNVPEPSTWALVGVGAAALVWQLGGGGRRKAGGIQDPRQGPGG